MTGDPGKGLLELRARLVALRSQTLAALAATDVIDAGLIALAADVNGAIAAVDAELAEHEPPAALPARDGNRAVRAVRDDAIRQLAGLLDRGARDTLTVLGVCYYDG
jgi:hypothetical protein